MPTPHTKKLTAALLLMALSQPITLSYGADPTPTPWSDRGFSSQQEVDSIIQRLKARGITPARAARIAATLTKDEIEQGLAPVAAEPSAPVTQVEAPKPTPAKEPVVGSEAAAVLGESLKVLADHLPQTNPYLAVAAGSSALFGAGVLFGVVISFAWVWVLRCTPLRRTP